MPARHLGERIAEARARAGYNKNQLARELGTSWQHVDHWERGRTQPSLSSLQRLAEVLHVSVDALLGARAEPEPSSGLERFLAEHAPADLSDDEREWLRRAPLDAREASADDYGQLLEGLRRIAPRPTPQKSGRRRKVDAAALEGAIARKRSAS